MEQESPQFPPTTVCIVYNNGGIWVVYSSYVHSVNNHPDNNGETGEYFCIYCTFVTKK